MVITTKSNGDIRLCVDLTKLNAGVEREIHPMPVADQTLAQLAGQNFSPNWTPTRVLASKIKRGVTVIDNVFNTVW